MSEFQKLGDMTFLKGIRERFKQRGTFEVKRPCLDCGNNVWVIAGKYGELCPACQTIGDNIKEMEIYRQQQKEKYLEGIERKAMAMYASKREKEDVEKINTEKGYY